MWNYNGTRYTALKKIHFVLKEIYIIASIYRNKRRFILEKKFQQDASKISHKTITKAFRIIIEQKIMYHEIKNQKATTDNKYSTVAYHQA